MASLATPPGNGHTPVVAPPVRAESVRTAQFRSPFLFYGYFVRQKGASIRCQLILSNNSIDSESRRARPADATHSTSRDGVQNSTFPHSASKLVDQSDWLGEILSAGAGKSCARMASAFGLDFEFQRTI